MISHARTAWHEWWCMMPEVQFKATEIGRDNFHFFCFFRKLHYFSLSRIFNYLDLYSRNCCIFHFCFGIFLFPSFPWLFRRAVGFQSTIFSMFKGSPCHEVKFLQDGLVVKYFSVVDTYLPPWYLNGWIMKPLESLGQPLYISLFAKIQHKTHKTNLNCTVFENHWKSLIQHCELRLLFKWLKVNKKMPKMVHYENLKSNRITRQVNFNWTKNGENAKIQTLKWDFLWFSNSMKLCTYLANHNV